MPPIHFACAFPEIIFLIVGIVAELCAGGPNYDGLEVVCSGGFRGSAPGTPPPWTKISLIS